MHSLPLSTTLEPRPWACPLSLAQVEDRPQVKERVTLMKEHRPVETEYVVSVEKGADVCRETLFSKGFGSQALFHRCPAFPGSTYLQCMALRGPLYRPAPGMKTPCSTSNMPTYSDKHSP